MQEAASDKCNERSVKCKEMRQQYNAEWKRHTKSLPEFREYEQQYNTVKMELARKHPAYMDNERECNNNKWLGKMQRTGILLIFSEVGRSVIGWRFMDLGWPRVFGVPTSVLLYYESQIKHMFYNLMPLFDTKPSQMSKTCLLTSIKHRLKSNCDVFTDILQGCFTWAETIRFG